jgi:peptide/nickel transport system substrate-binding protein
MLPVNFQRLTHAGALICGLFVATAATAEPQHGIAMYGDPELPADFSALPYANPEAPKGGRIIMGESGGFDSLNPYILKGRAPWGVRVHTVESLMGRNWDEPFTLYGLLAESVETSPERDWVEFTLRPEAKFSDGSPVTVEDVIWSYETVGTEGSPRYTGSWSKVESIEKTGERSLRITFNTPDRELALLMGLRPVLKKAQWEGRDFTESTLDAPIGSGPYIIGDFEPGRYISFQRNPDYWAKDLPLKQGQDNFDEVRYDYFGDGSVIFEAFKAGNITVYREFNEAKWNSSYNFPAVRSGEVVKSIFPHQRPSGMTGFVMNTRREKFQDWRVREALIHAFNFEFINNSLNGGDKPRISSYFSNSVLAMEPGEAQGRVRELMEPFSDELLPGAFEGYELPVSDGSEANRRNIRKALKLFQEAGWSVQDGVMKNAAGKPFTFNILLKQGAAENRSITSIYLEALKRLGINATVETVDSAQYKERTSSYDFDMTYFIRGLSLSPGNEQRLYWGAEGVEAPGTRNWMGMDSPAAEAMIDHMLNATDRGEFVAAVKALDRILTSGRYVIPIWYRDVSTVAHRKELKYPEKLPMYGDWLGFLPDVWWYEES